MSERASETESVLDGVAKLEAARGTDREIERDKR